MNSIPPDGAAIPYYFPAPNFPIRSYSGDNTNNMNSNILYIAIISLSIVLVLVFALHLYARFILRRQARRRAAIHHLSLAVARYSAADPPDNPGLDPAVISSLPKFTFKKRSPAGAGDSVAGGISGDGAGDSGPAGSSVLECSVCLSNVEDGEEVRLLPNCKHVFHVGCIDRWLAAHSTCPVCRTAARPVIEPRPREGPVGVGPEVGPTAEGTSEGGNKSGGSVSRLSSFRRILSRERSSSRRIQPSSSAPLCDDCVDRDLERQ